MTDKVVAPKTFKANSIISFINDCAPIFSYKGKRRAGFELDVSRVKECSMIGVLLVYKIMEYCSKQQCFTRPMISIKSEFAASMERYGFTKLITACVEDPERARRELRDLKITIQNSFIMAPQALLKSDRYTAEMLNKNYLPQIEAYYKNQPALISMVFQCLSEVLLNFWEHAVDDTESVIVAHGTKGAVEIACADNGKGIISTLRGAGKERRDDVSTLMSAVEKGVTSKELTNHMGYGLWIVDQIVSHAKGRLHLYSEGSYYQNEYGKIKAGTCGYWQGTVVYLSLPVANPVNLSDIEKDMKGRQDSIQIKWS
ncbi:MAG: ATP-binding protein [Flavobacteriales bacterium]|nr:ATP-binding protein [Flavobacteriales bacterium]